MTKVDRKVIEAREIQFYADIYKNEAYNQVGNRLRLRRELHSLQKLSGSKKFKRVLSVGCGHGEFEILLAPYVEHITAIDISPEAIEVANSKKNKHKIENIDFKCQSFSEINWNEKFDSIICLAFLHHVPEQALLNFLKQAYKNLKPGGFFYSQDPNLHGILRKIGRIVLGRNYDKYHTPDERELDITDLTKIIKAAGFQSVKIKYTDFTLIPGLYMFPKGPDLLMSLFLGTDLVLCNSPLASLASGFAAISRKI